MIFLWFLVGVQTVNYALAPDIFWVKVICAVGFGINFFLAIDETVNP